MESLQVKFILWQRWKGLVVQLIAQEWAQDCNSTKRAKFAVDQSDWTTLGNISQMHGIIYNEMVDAKIAEKIVIDNCNQFGKKVDTKLTHSEYCLFGDETRSNKSMKKMAMLLKPST